MTELDQDAQRKQRIKKWRDNVDLEPYQDAQRTQRIKAWIDNVDFPYAWNRRALAVLLLEFEKYLQACEAERMDK